MNIRIGRKQRTFFSLSAVWLMCCLKVARAQVPLPEAVLLPTDLGTGPADRDRPFLAWHENLGVDGYSLDHGRRGGMGRPPVLRRDRAVSARHRGYGHEPGAGRRASAQPQLLRQPGNRQSSPDVGH